MKTSLTQDEYILGEFGGIWAKLNINVEIVVANFLFSQIAVGTI